jgi:hypothetical protein
MVELPGLASARPEWPERTSPQGKGYGGTLTRAFGRNPPPKDPHPRPLSRERARVNGKGAGLRPGPHPWPPLPSPPSTGRGGKGPWTGMSAPVGAWLGDWGSAGFWPTWKQS